MSHPLLEQNAYTVTTPPICSLIEKADEWLRDCVTGGLVYGAPRLGKTFAARALVRRMNALTNPPATVLVNCNETGSESQGACYEDLLEEVHHPYRGRGSAVDKRSRFAQHLLGQVEQCGSNRMIVIFDDAHKLKPVQFQSLSETFNRLERKSIRSLFIFVGQRGLATTRSGMKNSGQADILGRFMTGSFEFKGVETSDELGQILAAYDEVLTFPVGSGISYTQHYMGERFASGWRLSAYAPGIWDAFTQVRMKVAAKDRTWGIPMQFVGAFVASLLVQLQVRPEMADCLTSDEFVRIVRAIGYGHHLGEEDT